MVHAPCTVRSFSFHPPIPGASTPPLFFSSVLLPLRSVSSMATLAPHDPPRRRSSRIKAGVSSGACSLSRTMAGDYAGTPQKLKQASACSSTNSPSPPSPSGSSSHCNSSPPQSPAPKARGASASSRTAAKSSTTPRRLRDHERDEALPGGSR